MTDELPPVAGPRRYRVSFNCRTDAVGTVIGLLIREVESPKMEKVGDDFNLTLVCMQDQLRAVLDMVLDDASNLHVTPYAVEVKQPLAVYHPPQQLRTVTTPLQRDIQILPPRRSSPGNAAPIRNTRSGRAALSAFADGGRIKHPPDFVEAMVAAGFNGNSWSAVVSKMVDEGDLVRVGRGSYRLPSTLDRHEVQQSFSPK